MIIIIIIIILLLLLLVLLLFVIKLRYDWEITDRPMICACGVQFSVDHAMVCQRSGFIIQRHNELCALEAEMLAT